MSDVIKLPSYKKQSESVCCRFKELHKRPIKLKLEGLSKTFHTSKGNINVLNSIDLAIHRREFISVIGPSGCGKSTLIRILAVLSRFSEAYPSQLSGGMKQRVAIARALANQPDVLFMDESFGALDPHTRSQMQSYLLQIWRNVDVTIVFVTHDLDEAIYLSDRILVLKANPGEIQEFIEIPVPRPRTSKQFLCPEFLAVKKHLEELVHPKISEEDEPSELPMVRMTSGHDVVE